MADDLVIEDRRTGVSIGELHGVDAAIENMQAQDELFGPTTFEPIAVRGEHLALFRTHAVSTSGFELVSLGIIETNEAGQQCAMTFFDEEALADALEELDARHTEISGEERSTSEASLLEGVGLLNRREWDRFSAMLHPDLVAIDHSPLGFPPTDRDGFVNDQMRGMAELVPDFVVVVGKILTEGRATLAVGTTLGTTADGNEYRWDFIQVFRAADDGRGLHRDLYADTQWDEALARFDEFAAEDAPTLPSTGPENLLTHRLRAAVVQLQGRDEADGVAFPPDAEIGAAFLIADDIVILDRRAGVSAGTITGAADFLANANAHFAVFAEARPTVVAVRGERLALVRMDFEADGFVSTRINIFEADQSGALVSARGVRRRRRSPPHSTSWSHVTRRSSLWARTGPRSPGAVRSTRSCAATATLPSTPSLPSSPARTGGAAPPSATSSVVSSTSTPRSQAPRSGWRTSSSPPSSWPGTTAALASLRWHNGDGFELAWLLLTEVDADGRILRITNFDVDERDAASAVLHEWAAAAPQLTPRLAEANAIRMDALARGDRDAVLATYTPDFVRDDRRRGINFGTSNREETVDALLAGPAVGLGNMAFTPIEVIGDHFALGEFRMSHDDGFELVYLLAAEEDDEGRLRRATNFDLEDLEIASALFREWAAERGEAGGVTPTSR